MNPPSSSGTLRGTIAAGAFRLHIRFDLCAPGEVALQPEAALPGRPERDTLPTEACLTGDETTEIVLARQASGDHDGARLLLVSSTQASLSRFLRRLVGDEETARELFQDTYLRAFRALGSFRGDASLTTWVLTIGRNLAMTRLGRDRARLRSELPLEPGTELPGADALARRPADEVLTRSVFRALDALPVAQREAVLLFYGEDMPLDEIAAVTGRPLNTVKSDLLRARARLRSELGVTP